MKNILIHTHTGLGDYFITNGIMHSYTLNYDKVYLIYIKMFRETVQELYKGFESITPIEFPDVDVTKTAMREVRQTAQNLNAEMISLADPYLHYPERLIFNKDQNLVKLNVAVNFDRQFYELAGLPFACRYTNCRIPAKTERSEEIYQTLSGGEDYILIHGGSSQQDDYGLAIDQLTSYKDLKRVYIKPGVTNNVLDFVTLIERAKEIHAVGSFFQCLVDSMVKRTKADLIFHDVMMKHETQVSNKWNDYRWKVVNYGVKY
jgi:hypothetical protein